MKKNVKPKKILVTGGAGAIGLHLTRLLSDQGHEVVSVDNFFRGESDNDFKEIISRPNVTFIEADLASRVGWNTLGSGYDYVYHLAAVNGTKLFYEIPHEVLRVDTLATAYALEWFKEKNPKGKILFTSSCETHADASVPTSEDVPLTVPDVYNPRWVYAGTKIIGEQFFIHYGQEYNLRTCIVRPFNYYGPRAGYDHVIPEFIERIQKRMDPFPIYGSDNTRTFCYLPDAVEGIQLVMESDKTVGGIYNVSRHHSDEISMVNLAGKLFDIAGWTPKKLNLKEGPLGSVKRRAPNVSKVEKEVGWKAKTPLEVGLQKTFDWYQKNPKKSQ